MPSCSGPIQAQKLEANSVPREVFTHLLPKKRFVLFPSFKLGKKYIKMIGHMPWLYIYRAAARG